MSEYMSYDEALGELLLGRDELNELVANGELRAFHEGDEIRRSSEDGRGGHCNWFALSYDVLVPALEERYRVLRYDWRGHGDTDAPPGPYTLDQFEGDAVGFMDALGLPSVHWVGISTGGMIGQGLAINHAMRVATLTLCNTTSQSNPWYQNWVAERQAVVKQDGMDPVWDMTKRLWFTDGFVDEGGSAYEAVRDVFVRTPVPGYLGGTSAVADLAYRDRLHEISCPTRIIGAGDDPATPIEQSYEIRDPFPVRLWK